VFLALCMAAAGLARGLLIASKNTKVIAVSSLLRIIAVFAVGAFAISYGADNGAMIGMLALTIAFGTEATYLAWQLLRLDRRQPRLFDKCSS
jgi:Na+-driven multidrug efflux pump